MLKLSKKIVLCSFQFRTLKRESFVNRVRGKYLYEQSQLPIQRSSLAISENTNSYKRKAFEISNPYADILRPSQTTKPKTRKERYLEQIRNRPRPRFGDGKSEKHCIDIKRKKSSNSFMFYKDDSNLKSFSKLGINEELCYKAAEKNASKPTDVQCIAIPLMLADDNNLFIAPTGSGKTYAAVLPVLTRLIQDNEKGLATRSGFPRAVLMAPGKELVIQLSKVVEHLCEDLPLTSACIVGGKGTKERINYVQSNPTDIVIGTSGTLLKLFKEGGLNISDMKYLMLDEVDVLLGSASKVDAFLFLQGLVKEEMEKRITVCQVNMFGATLPKSVLTDIQRTIPNLKTYIDSNSHRPHTHIDQRFWFVTSRHKPKHFLIELKKLLSEPKLANQRIIVFCNHTDTCEWLHHFLQANSVEHLKLNSHNKSQYRLNMADAISNTNVPIIATDAGSRGLDMPNVNVIINFEFPYTYEDYLHRVGRTGRLGSHDRNCMAVSYVSHKHALGLFYRIEHFKKGAVYPNLVNPNGFVTTPKLDDIVPLSGSL